MRTFVILQVIFLFSYYTSVAQIPDSTLTDTFTDYRDGHIYKTVIIGNQRWMAENLAYLPAVNLPTEGSVTDPHYYVYDYNGTDIDSAKVTGNYITYGVLYNWLAAMDSAESSITNPSGVRGICPEGWHLPGDTEWTDLENFLIVNGFNCDSTTREDKTAMSLADTTDWRISEVKGSPGNFPESNNKSGFSALPGGRRDSNGEFSSMSSNGYWWSARENGPSHGWFRTLNYFYDNFSRYHFSKDYGLSVRCVKD